MSEAATWTEVELVHFDTAPNSILPIASDLTVCVEHDSEARISFRDSENTLVEEFQITGDLEVGTISSDSVSLYCPQHGGDENKSTFIVKFKNSPEKAKAFCKKVAEANAFKQSQCSLKSQFDKRTESWSAVQYFQFYSFLSQQQNMMQDYIRTSTYQRAFQLNAGIDFTNKVVLDVGAGSGILSFFAAHCGAKKVYAVEASNMAGFCQKLVQANKLAGRIVVISGKIEDVILRDEIDIIISEPMGYMLYNERMLESYVHARKFLAKRHLQPVLDKDGKPTGEYSNKAALKSGVMFPTVANMYVAPFSDEALFAEQQNKANFWYQTSFHGMDLSSLRESAIAEYFNQPVVDTFDISICPALPNVHKIDFRTVDESEFHDINMDLDFNINQCCTIHGLAFWFDVGFLGSKQNVWLSTSPTEPLTHWYQVRCLFTTPLFVQEDQNLKGSVRMKANTRQSYDVDIELIIPGTTSKIKNTIDLKNPHFRYTGYATAPPPGSHTKSPTEVYINNMAGSGVQNQQPSDGFFSSGGGSIYQQGNGFVNSDAGLDINMWSSMPASSKGARS